MCVVCIVKRCSWLVILLLGVLRVLRNDLKSYETEGTGSFCFGENLEKSTAIQVKLMHLFAVFQCSHRPPRARSRFVQMYDSGRGDQVESVHVGVRDIQWGGWGRRDFIGRLLESKLAVRFLVRCVDDDLLCGVWMYDLLLHIHLWSSQRCHPCFKGLVGWFMFVGLSCDLLFAALTPNYIRGYPLLVRSRIWIELCLAGRHAGLCRMFSGEVR
jgi:hypothetical protein